MRRLAYGLVVIMVVFVLTHDAWAQRPGGRRVAGGIGEAPAFLLIQQSVQEDLGLSGEQKQKVAAFAASQRGAMAGLRDLSRQQRQAKLEEMRKQNEAEVAAILSDEQQKRLKQISWQVAGPRAFANPEVAEALKLSGQQREQIRDIQDDAQHEMRELAQDGNRAELREKFEALRKSTRDKAMAVLTSEQQATWKELTGKPFEGEIRRGGFGGEIGRAHV